ncbi:MAG TPA: DVUA0089 family protein, partial [Polyangiaceae bacterium LLY-WYZ-15_(1-7)]|nr:DVUA0089 family protein [Polyangiaceae bacterium LLY-WYZ-15_(1-7)]
MDRFAFPLLLTAVLLAGLGLQACAAQPAAKGDEEAAPLMGALDSFRSPTLQGELPFGEPAPAAIRDDARFHAWDFALDGAASVRLVTGPVDGGGETDTVVYLYREGPRGWGSTIAKNDDAPGTFFSDLAVELEAGTYRVLVKGYSRWTRGPFELLGLCEGAGCPGASEPSLGAEGDDCSAELSPEI